MNDFYEPLIRRINAMILMNENKPDIPFSKEPDAWDDFTKEYCIEYKLSGGELNADTIFTVGLPLRYTLVAINGYAKIKQLAGNFNKRVLFWNRIKEIDVLQELLPQDHYRTQNLMEFCRLLDTRANIMILPEKALRKKNIYMPYFLWHCFEGGKYFSAFGSKAKVREWIVDQNLAMFFDGGIEPEYIKNLSGRGGENCDIDNKDPRDVDLLMCNYLDILHKREECFRELYSNEL